MDVAGRDGQLRNVSVFRSRWPKAGVARPGNENKRMAVQGRKDSFDTTHLATDEYKTVNGKFLSFAVRGGKRNRRRGRGGDSLFGARFQFRPPFAELVLIIGGYPCSGSTQIIHETPNLSATTPKRGEKKVRPIGMWTWPPVASASK